MYVTLASGIVLLISLLALPWFAASADGAIAAGSESGAFEWLDSIAAVLLAVALVAVGAPAARLTGVLRARPKDVGVVLAACGLAATALIAFHVVSPPELDRELAHAASGVGVTPRGGAVVGLLAAAGILAGGVLDVFGAAPAGRVDRPVSVPTGQPRSTGPTRSALATATVEDLRAVGLSITQARRVVRYRDELGLVETIADLDQVPGIPASLRTEVERRLGA